MRPDSKATRVMNVLREGPATTGEVAAELGWPVHNTCAHLQNLFLRGKIERQPFVKPAEASGPRHVFLWSVGASA